MTKKDNNSDYDNDDAMNNGGKAKNTANLSSHVIPHVIIQEPFRPFFITHILTYTCICVFWPKLENPEFL